MAAKAKKSSHSKKASKAKVTPEKKLTGVEKALEGFNPTSEQEQLLSKLKAKLDKYKVQVMKKFDKYIMAMSLLPPDEKKPEVINLLVLIDDRDSTQMSKYELKDKITKILDSIALDIDKNILPSPMLLSELWQHCYDGKDDVLKQVGSSAPIHDDGMLAAFKITEIHKSMVLKKFEKYIVSYVLAGSLVQGKATETSDIDVFIVIDDTDVKRMTRTELKDKLRAIIIGMGLDAAEITGIKNKLNIQIYILTDFWENIKEANPIIFTFLRDGVPLYDRGIFMPWKHLLRMGKIRPSREAIDMFMSSGDQVLQRIKFKIRDIGLEDCFWATITPSQAALMMYGIPPPTPKETPDMLREVFVKKERLLEERFVKMFEHILDTRKEIEHGTKKDLTGTEVDVLVKNATDFLTRLKKLFTQIGEVKEAENAGHAYDDALQAVRDVLRLEGAEVLEDSDLVEQFKAVITNKGKFSDKQHRLLSVIIKQKKVYDTGKLSKAELHKFHQNVKDLTKHLVEYLQRARGQELEKTRIRVKYGDQYGEVLLLGKEAFIIHDIDAEEKQISRADIDEKGALQNVKGCTMKEFEEALSRIDLPPKVFVKQPIFNDLKLFFGKEVEILLHH